VEHLGVLEQGRPVERVERHLLAAGWSPVGAEELRTRTDLDEATVRESLEALTAAGTAIAAGSKGELGLLHAERVGALEREILARLTEFHAKEPLKDGLAKEELRSKLPGQLAPAVYGWLLARLGAAGQIAVTRDKVRLFNYRPTLSPEEEALKGRIEQVYREAAFQPPSPDVLYAGLKVERRAGHGVFRRLVDDGILVRLGEEIFLHREAYQALQSRVQERLAKEPRINVGSMKELFGVSRKYAIPFLEHLDDIKITRREGDERVPYK
jgi:selenocysteine-specific elongation factor